MEKNVQSPVRDVGGFFSFLLLRNRFYITIYGLCRAFLFVRHIKFYNLFFWIKTRCKRMCKMPEARQAEPGLSIPTPYKNMIKTFRKKEGKKEKYIQTVLTISEFFSQGNKVI